jgi:flavin-dependent dehydrogenase
VTAEALVVGGGPAGAAAAILLARAGRAVTLLEREVGPHDKVCGEFISHEATAYLTRLGIDLGALGAAPIQSARLADRRGAVEIALPFPAFSLSRRKLDEALLDLARDAGVDLRRGMRARRLAPEGAGWSADLGDAGSVRAAAAFLAVGKHDLKGWKRPQGRQGDLVGFKMHLRLAPDQASALDGHVELMLFPGGYAGLEPIEDGLANLALLARRSALPEGDIWPGLLALMRDACPLLDERLRGAETLWPKPLAIAAIPYGHVQQSAGGVWRLGDQAAVIPSFAGDGLAIALHSAHLAAKAYLDGRTAESYQRALARDLSAQVLGATLLSQAMVRPWGQSVLTTLARLQPRLMTAAATRTRISGKALRRAGPDARAVPARPGPGPSGCTLPSGRG